MPSRSECDREYRHKLLDEMKDVDEEYGYHGVAGGESDMPSN